MSIEIIVKANDGRGRGHIGRVMNFVDYDYFKDMMRLIVHRGYSDMVPERMNISFVTDYKWRVNLDYGKKKGVYKKVGNTNHSENKVELTSEVIDALTSYYFSLLDGVGSKTKLLYIDDQNSPETLFPERIGDVIGVVGPGSIARNAPKTKVAFELETQIWNNTGDFSMGVTRRDAFQRADYLHLSTDVDFFKSAIDGHMFDEQTNSKIIPMGFPISSELLRMYQEMNSDSQAMQRSKERLAQKIGVAPSKRICYISFGAGSGAEDVYPAIIDAMDNIGNDYAFIITNTAGKGRGVEKVLADKGYTVRDGNTDISRVIETKEGKEVYTIRHSQGEHQEALAAADLLILGNGSGTTYEGIASQTPMVCIPLNRPGYEQIIKGIGVERSGGGKVLFLEEVKDQLEDFKDLTCQDGKIPSMMYNTNNLVSTITSLDIDLRAYSDNLRRMDEYFASPESIKRSILDMAYGLEVQNIIRNNGLKSFL